MIEIESARRDLASAMEQGARDMPDARLSVASPTRAADVPLSEIHAAGARFGAHLVAMGIAPGDVVAVQLPAWSEWMIACVGIARAGAVMLPVVSPAAITI